MTDVNELLADPDHAGKALERLAGLKLYEISANNQKNGQNPADNVLIYPMDENRLDRSKIKNISYIETLFLLNQMLESGKQSKDGRKAKYPWNNYHYVENRLDDYLFSVCALCVLVQKNESFCPELRVVLATPLDTIYQALLDMCDKNSADRLLDVYKGIRQAFRSRSMVYSKPDGKTTVKEILSQCITDCSKKWIPGSISINAYEIEIREAYRDIGRLLVEMPVCAFNKTVDIEDILNKYKDEEEPFIEMPGVSNGKYDAGSGLA